jgi:hypothetical protein
MCIKRDVTRTLSIYQIHVIFGCYLFSVLFVCKCVLPPGDNPTAVNKYIIIILESHGLKRGSSAARLLR